MSEVNAPKVSLEEQIAGFPDRFVRRVSASPNGCWLWTGSLSNGYGSISVGGRRKRAHRFSWERIVGPIPPGMVLDHMCRQRNCVNPAHLRVVTLAQNSTENSLSPTAINKQKTACFRGHPLSPDNLLNKGFRQRYCKICNQENNRKYRAQNARKREEKRERLRKDAERYRWLRSHLPVGTLGDFEITSPDSLDAAIDAALKERT